MRPQQRWHRSGCLPWGGGEAGRLTISHGSGKKVADKVVVMQGTRAAAVKCVVGVTMREKLFHSSGQAQPR